MSQRIRTTVFGLGHAASVYVPALQAHPRFDLVSLASSHPGRAAEIAAQRKISRAFENWHDALEDPQVELVVITSAHPLREEQLRLALANGKHVLVEPPLTDHPARLDAILSAAAKHDRVAAAAFPLRYLSARQALRELVVNGHLGDVHYAAWRHFSVSWRPTGVLHALDALRVTLGAVEGEAVQRIARPRGLLLQMAHAGGAVVSQLAIDGRSATEDFSFTIVGSSRVALIVGERPDGGELHVIEGDVEDEYALRPSPYQRFAAAHRNVPPFMELLDDLALAVDGRESALPGFADAAEAQRIAG
ncbi:MAG: Gfo/Idh/MocA family oxidoreductase [bacterium]|nr:Gfo/Idh/MocA family oxidoreductase [bacterium]